MPYPGAKYPSVAGAAKGARIAPTAKATTMFVRRIRPSLFAEPREWRVHGGPFMVS